MDKIKAFLHKGYFPIQLPPGFTTKEFADGYTRVEGRWSAQKTPDSRPEKFSVARSSYYRRITGIVNPVSYYFLTKEITEYWTDIQRHFRKSKISLSKPKLNPDLRAIEIIRFSDLYEAKITMSTGYRFVLVTDITSFFPSIYTHTIPWAIHGKEVAKRYKDKTPSYYGNILDGRSMGLQDRQTIGLPIGPDTSHVIAEIIGVSIDKEIKDSLGYWPKGFRYVDDFYLFFDSREEAEKALVYVTKAISNYEMQINPAKTRIIEVKDLVKESWKYNVKKLKLSDNIKQQREDIHNYFASIFSLEKKFNDESLIKYGLKQISSSIIRMSNWEIFEAYLLKCGLAFPNTLQVIVTILTTYNHHGYRLKTNEIERFCNNLIKTHAISDHHSEVSWLLWLCKELHLNIKRETVREVESMSSSVCILIILDMYHSGIIRNNIRVGTLRQFSNKESLYQSNWLLSYEGGRRKWLANADTTFISDDHFFGKLMSENIGFYDESLKCKPIFEFKDDSEQVDDIELFFDSNEHIEMHFDFDEMDEEYFDSTEENEEEEDDESDTNDLNPVI